MYALELNRPAMSDTPALEGKRALHLRWKEASVVGRFATSREIAATIGFRLSDAAGYCCRTEIVVYGGRDLDRAALRSSAGML